MRSDELRHAARYQWRYILPALGIPPEKLTNRHQPCPVCGGRDRYRFDDRDGSGSYICTHCGNGDGFSLVMHWLDCDYRTAAAAVSDVLGIGEGKTPTPRRKPPTSPPARPRDEIDRLLRIWNATLPLEAGDPVATYLEGRGLPFPENVHDLRHHPRLPYWHNGEKLGEYPAMIGRITDTGGRTTGLHLTYIQGGRKLEQYDHGERLPAKKMRRRYPGSLKTCALRLYPVAEELAVAEGIETALAVRAMTGLPVWACLSCHGLEQLALPPVKRLLIYCDGDVPGWRAGDALAAHALRTGIEVAIKKPDHGDALDHYNARKQA